MPLIARAGLMATVSATLPRNPAGWAHWHVDMEGMSDNPAPRALWIWVGLTAVALAVLLAACAIARWWRRAVSLLAVPLCALSTGLALNQWVGYFPTVQTAWNQLTAGPLPDETEMATVTPMAQEHVVPDSGAVVPVTIGSDASKFKHRNELVYLPTAWFASDPLPAVLMIGGEFNTPADWLRTGNAAKTIDDFARAQRSTKAQELLRDAGLTGGRVLENGFIDWEGRGLAVDRGARRWDLERQVRPWCSRQFSAASSCHGSKGWPPRSAAA